jgi:hypothetical protein
MEMFIYGLDMSLGTLRVLARVGSKGGGDTGCFENGREYPIQKWKLGSIQRVAPSQRPTRTPLPVL